MRKNGFTLVELLAVIAIIGLVATIAVPVILSSVNSTKEQAFMDNAKSLQEASNTYYQEQHLLPTMALPLLVTYNNGTATYCNGRPKLDYTGKGPDSGNIYIDKTGNIEMKIYDKKTEKCIVKGINDSSPYFENLTQTNCKLTGKTC